MDGSAHTYRGRIAPSPSGFLHLGHARTFLVAEERARAAKGCLLLRNDDLDAQRSRPEYTAAMLDDLHWLGIRWNEGPSPDGLTESGSFGPYRQSVRHGLYRDAFHKLLASGQLYRCTCSRRDLQGIARAPHAEDDDEPIYPGTCRFRDIGSCLSAWRFRVPDGERVQFLDAHLGLQSFVAGRDFGDFLVLRRDNVPSYQLACVIDDAAMGISEVVRGRDLLVSTARQILLQRALGLPTPGYYHCALMVNEAGNRLAKRHDALSIRALREAGHTPEQVRTTAFAAPVR